MTGSATSERENRLYQLACDFAAETDLDELIPLVVRECRRFLRAESAAVLLLDPERGELYFPYVAVAHPEIEERLLGLRFPAREGIAGAALATNSSILCNDPASDPRFYPGIDAQTGMITHALIATPLRGPRGTTGVLEAMNPLDGVPFAEADLSILERLARSIEVAVDNARLHSELTESGARWRARAGALRRELARRARPREMIGNGESMERVFRLMESAASSTIPVLIRGETGTGKELVARGIHQGSERADGPFVAVNCAAIPETLLESELFGHRRGSFTGASEDRAGFLEAASGGTAFLDEVGDMPRAMQAKLLRAVEAGEVIRLGETQPRRADVRVIAATNADLVARVQHGGFREDLYYRLNAFPIELPPLRDRREDIPFLASRFLAQACQEMRKQVKGIDRAALDCLVVQDWPGNVRELRNEIARAATLAKHGERIALEHLSARLVAGEISGPAPAGNKQLLPLRRARAEFEADYIRRALEHLCGNVSGTARALGLSRAMLQKKIKDYRVDLVALRGTSGEPA